MVRELVLTRVFAFGSVMSINFPPFAGIKSPLPMTHQLRLDHDKESAAFSRRIFPPFLTNIGIFITEPSILVIQESIFDDGEIRSDARIFTVIPELSFFSPIFVSIVISPERA